FSKIFKTEVSYGSYKALMQDERIDVIYIATPHVFHYELTMECIKHGKAVLCEKPFAMDHREAREMVDLARSKGVFLMEAMWTMFLPHFQFALEKIQSGDYGQVRSLKADFGFEAEYDPAKRLFNRSLGGGSLLDIGIYPIFMAYSVLGMPREIKAKAEFSDTGVDYSSDIKFIYKEGITANLFSTFKEKTPTTAEIQLEKAKIILNTRFHEPSSVTIISEKDEETIEFGVETNGYNFEAAHVTKMLQAGRTESDMMTLDKTLDIMQLLDKVRDGIGLSYQ
ncbi:MAG: Gfo/Idh/MocA family oxidoreductase, partial [Gramella sp.]|nr:Gfo/Idh/MocA family oxidoreductase [Christiangramia sp.]